MKKIITILFLGIIFFPLNVYAFSGKTTISCNKTSINPGESVTCSIKGEVSSGEVNGISTKLTASSNLTITNVRVDSGWNGDSEVNLDLYTSDNKTSTFAIATFEIQAKSTVTNGSDESVKLSSTTFSDQTFNEHNITDSSLKIRIKSTINTLTGITLSSGTLSPAFSSNNLNYSLTLNADKVTITATKTDSKSTISGDTGEVKLNYGTNTLKINVTSESNSEKTYTITITRPDTRSTDNTLESLTLNYDKINLESTVTEYRYEVNSTISQLKIAAVLNSSKASFVTNYGPRTVDLKEEENKIELKVAAENGSIRTYNLIVNRKPEEKNESTENESQSTTTSKNNTGNPKTGSYSTYVVCIIAMISIITALGIYFYKIKQKKKESKNEQE